jgi:hypothetical protein
LSLFAIGGANAAIPEMHRIAVEVERWMTERQFTDAFALAQVSPGPNVIIVTLIGYHVAGLAGALVATAAMTGPTCLFAYVMTRLWDRFKDAPWRNAGRTGPCFNRTNCGERICDYRSCSPYLARGRGRSGHGGADVFYPAQSFVAFHRGRRRGTDRIRIIGP